MELCTATLAHFKKNHQLWTAYLPDRKTKVCLPLSDLKIIEGDTLRDIQHSEPRPKPERQKTVILQLETKDPEPKIHAWALAPV